METTVREFKHHDVITYKVDADRTIKVVNYIMDTDCYPLKFGTMIEFLFYCPRLNPRRAIYSCESRFVYEGANCLFDEYNNEIKQYHHSAADFLEDINISLKYEDITVFSYFLETH